MPTFDQRTIDSTGSFLVHELERLDQNLHEPLASVTWGRDIQVREDVSIADDISSFTTTTYAASGTPNPNGKNWIGKDSTALAGVNVDIAKQGFPLTLWGMELGWTLPELESAIKVGRPIDFQKYRGMQLKWNMDTDAQVYVGDKELGQQGLLNQSGVARNTVDRPWAEIMSDSSLSTSQKAEAIKLSINNVLTASWKATGYSVTPTDLLLPPEQFALLAQTLISEAGSVSVLEFLRQNTISYVNNGRPLNIKPVKWASNVGVRNSGRMVAYTNMQDYVRFPMVPLQQAPLQYRGIFQLVPYYGKLGVVETVYPETIAYVDGV